MSKFNFKKVLTLVLSVAMIGSQGVTAFATQSSTDPASGTTLTNGNILDYTIEKVVVPTNLKVALNPNGYSVIKNYTKLTPTQIAADVQASQQADGYYTYNDSTGKYERALTAGKTTLDAFAANTDYYIPNKVTDKVVSLNYGIVNKSTEDKIVNVELRVGYTDTNAAGKDIEFVDTEADAIAVADSGNAAKEELKMYLAVQSSSALPTTKTFKKAAKADHATTTTYYSFDGSKYTKLATQPADGDALQALQDTADLAVRTAIAAGSTVPDNYVYEETTAIGPAIRTSELGDVTMTAAGAALETKLAPATIDTDATIKATASLDYLLNAATWTPRNLQDISYDDTPTTLEPKLEISNIGGVAGFTITGNLNRIADWTKAKATVLTFKPVYTISENDVETEAVTGAYNQVTVNRAPQISMTSAGVVTITNATCTSSQLKAAVGISGTTSYSLIGNNATFEDPSSGTIVITMGSAWLTQWSGRDVSVKVTLADDTELTSNTVTFD
jgi:hypothetical protein